MVVEVKDEWRGFVSLSWFTHYKITIQNMEGITMLPDYSTFNKAQVAVAKLSHHTHPGGETHLEIEVILPPNMSDQVKFIIDGMDKVMNQVPGAYMVHSQSYTGAEADLHNEDIADYYNRSNFNRDRSHEN